MGCVFLTVDACILPHTEFVPDDHLENAPHFSIQTACFQALVRNPDQATIFHDGSDDENCDRNISDVDYPNWHCPSPEWGYPVAVFSMILISISASFRAGLPSKLTAQWFEPNEYDIVNALASLADVFGTMIIFLIVPFVAKEPSDLLYLQVYFAIPVFLSFIGSLFIMREGYKNEVNEQSMKVSVSSLIKFIQKAYIQVTYTLVKGKTLSDFSNEEYKRLFAFIWLLYLWFS